MFHLVGTESFPDCTLRLHVTLDTSTTKGPLHYGFTWAHSGFRQSFTLLSLTKYFKRQQRSSSSSLLLQVLSHTSAFIPLFLWGLKQVYKFGWLWRESLLFSYGLLLLEMSLSPSKLGGPDTAFRTELKSILYIFKAKIDCEYTELKCLELNPAFNASHHCSHLMENSQMMAQIFWESNVKFKIR